MLRFERLDDRLQGPQIRGRSTERFLTLQMLPHRFVKPVVGAVQFVAARDAQMKVPPALVSLLINGHGGIFANGGRVFNRKRPRLNNSACTARPWPGLYRWLR